MSTTPYANRLLAAASSIVAVAAAADFTNSFDGITQGEDVRLTWEGVAAQHYPLCITAQVIERIGGGDGDGDVFKANAYRMNITTNASGGSYVWTGAPYPLRWIPSGWYQLELRPTSWEGGEAPLLASSTVFGILDPVRGTGQSGWGPPAPPVANQQSDGGPALSKPVAIGLGVAIGVPSVIALAVVAWFLRKRQRRAALEKQRLKRSEFVIH